MGSVPDPKMSDFVVPSSVVNSSGSIYQI